MKKTTTIKQDWQISHNGMTVVELLIILTAIAIVVLISVPSSTMVLEHYRLKSASSSLVESLNLAKTEAVKRNSVVRVCPSSNGRFCRTDGNWNHGWLVYSDGNQDGTVQEIELIKSFDAPSEHVFIVAEGAITNMASFTLAGLKQDHDAQTGDFVLCHDGSNARHKIISIDRDGWVNASATETGSPVCSSI